MSSGSDDLQNRSNVRTNPSIRGESPLSSSSSEVVWEVNQASPASCSSTPSASGREVSSTVTLKKAGGRKRTDVGVPEMRGSLDKRDAPVARALDEELRRTATEASMARSRITVEELEELRLSYDIPSSVLLRAPDPKERTDDLPEGFVAIYEPAMQQGLRLPMHPFFREVLNDWNLAPCQITPKSWGQVVASYLLWVVAEAGGNLNPRKFESIYRPCRSSGWYNVSPRPGQKWGTATDSPNKVYNWKERFFFVGGDWEFIPEDPLPYVSILCRFGELDCGKPPIPKKNQGELRSKWDKVRALSSEFRSLNNLLKDDNLLASCGLMAFRIKGVLVIRLVYPASVEGSSAQASQKEASGLLQEAQATDHQVSFLLYVLRSMIMFPRARHRPPTFTLTPPLRGTKGRRSLREPKRLLLRRGKPLQPRRGLYVMPIRRGGQRKAVGPRHLWMGNLKRPEILCL
ncbi:Uncharacterized protein Adt_02602 [Abeliophyllum distichum]|uniref:Transposase (putative) gypsy type domain-containing protein n=1 Tax=Abeliophyllum distichum TaxID=126358 RepID=A0ABD1VW51_9LAMI